jgi:hypothetical protein
MQCGPKESDKTHRAAWWQCVVLSRVAYSVSSARQYMELTSSVTLEMLQQSMLLLLYYSTNAQSAVAMRVRPRSHRAAQHPN